MLNPNDILGWEFEYARTTASEAMRDRLAMINFYLVIAGVITTAVVFVLRRDGDLPTWVGTVLLWCLCIVGWIEFLKIIRLRQAWHDSATAMNQIKEFYIAHTKTDPRHILATAFKWKQGTLPRPEKKWTVFFYSAVLIGFLDSAAFVAGGASLELESVWTHPAYFISWLGPMGVALFLFHVWLYWAFLRSESQDEQ
jgi:hypothetical protein